MSAAAASFLQREPVNVADYLDVESSGSDSDPRGAGGGLSFRGRCGTPAAARLTGLAVLGSLVGCAYLLLPRPAHVQSDAAAALHSVGLDARPDSRAPASALKPVELMHDGNVCDLEEEFYAGLCYKKCASLTGGEAPIRTSSWTCCTGHPCTLANEMGSLGTRILCNGYDVAANGGCPHKPGSCLLDEEMHLGVCYKKCSLLTHGAFPHRVAAATCCKTEGLGCLDFRDDETSGAFDVGGGAGDHDPSTLAGAHLPQESLTEAASPATTPAPEPSLDEPPAPPSPDEAPAPPSTEHEQAGDSRTCRDTEELYAGLCYRKCSLLTQGKAPIRTSSWTCCEGHPCGMFNQRGAVGKTLLCNGFDVAGDGSCPHKPGTCLPDEELHLGVCYKKCSILTRGRFPHRVAAATCCKVGGLGCLDFRKDLTSEAFDVAGDGDVQEPAAAGSSSSREEPAPQGEPAGELGHGEAWGSLVGRGLQSRL